MNSKNNVRRTKRFLRELKRLLRKYPSLISDLEELNKTLLANPRTGDPLGDNNYKIRMAITSKGKGKSGGARIISNVETEIIGVVQNNEINLLTIYEKGAVDSISKEHIAELKRNAEFD